jgi:hypothetical protein
VSYAGERRQTFMFHHRDVDLLQRNLAATRELIGEVTSSGIPVREPAEARWVFDDLESGVIEQFLREYSFHPAHADLNPDAMVEFLHRWEDAGYPVRWNLAIVGSSRTAHRYEGRELELGSLDLGLDQPVGLLNRSRLRSSTGDTANIKSLMSSRDRVVDLRGLGPGQAGLRDRELQVLRTEHAPGVGLLAVYPISKASVPLSRVHQEAGSREALDAADDIVGIGIVFPDVPPGAPADLLTGQYVQVDLRGATEERIEQDEAEWERGGEAL